MNSQLLPWKWEAVKYNEVQRGCELKDGNGSAVLAIHHTYHSRAPLAYDMRLIAAAPELLEMLRDTVEKLRHLAGYRDYAALEGVLEASALIKRIEEGAQ